MDCAHAVREVAEATGPIHYALGHSIGAVAALLAGEGRQPMPRAFPFEAYVLVGMPDRFSDVTRRFGDELNLSRSALRVFEPRLEQLACRSIEDFTGSKLIAATQRPTFLLHSRDDEVVPFEDAERLAAAMPSAEFKVFDDLGHRLILYAPQTVRAAASFFLQHRSRSGSLASRLD